MDDDIFMTSTRPSYRTTWRQHRRLLSIPMVLAVVVAAFLQLSAAKTYKSTAEIWVDTAPPAASSVGSGSPVLGTTPAAAEQGILGELITTRTFQKNIAQNSLLGRYPGAASATGLADALAPANVLTVPAGPQVLQISYLGPSPEVATSTLGAMIKQLQADNSGYTSQHDAAALAYDRSQVDAATQAVSAARGQVNAYLRSHPGTPVNDPTLTSLVANETSLTNQLTQAQTALSQVAASRNGGGWMIQVIDAPGAATPMSGSKKKLVETILGGLLAGGLVSFLGAVALTPGRKETWEDEVSDVLSGGSPVPGDSPMPPEPAFVGGGSHEEGGGSRLAGARRLIVPRRSGDSSDR